MKTSVVEASVEPGKVRSASAIAVIAPAAKLPLASRFIAEKMWAFFAYPDPDSSIIATILSRTVFQIDFGT